MSQLEKPILRKFKSVQIRTSKDGLKKSGKQYDAYIMFIDSHETALIPKSIADFLIEKKLVTLQTGEEFI